MRIALVGVLVAGCTDQVAEPVEVFKGPAPLYEEELQGRWLLGSVPDRLSAPGADHVSVLADTANGHRASVAGGSLIVRDANGALVAAGADQALVGLVLIAADGTEVQIAAAATDPNVGGPVYQLQYKSKAGAWTDYCANGDVAVAMQGTWTATGFHRNDNNISFGCSDGTTFKCFTWGYVPGPAASTAWDAHQACTRMARADVCGDGTPHTREETPIVIRDYLAGYHDAPTDVPALRHAATFPAPPDRHFYESAWTAGENIGAVCLSRIRWASLPVGGCASLPDPRITAGAKYCEDMSNDELLLANALLANASKTQDMYLHRWKNPATSDVVSTVRGFYSDGPDRVIPFPGYTEYLGSDGILLRNLPGSLEPSDVIEVFSTGALDRVLLPDATLTRADPSFEGYLLAQPGADRVPFNEYQRGGVDRLTSVDPQDKSFTLTAPLFYVITP